MPWLFNNLEKVLIPLKGRRWGIDLITEKEISYEREDFHKTEGAG